MRGSPDPNYCPALNLYIGSACNDNNAATINDMVNANCECVGSPNPNYCPALNLYVGSACNDNNAATINDMVNANCECVGTPDPNLPCP